MLIVKISIFNEIQLMRIFDHPSIIKLYEVFEGEERIYLVLEFVRDGIIFKRLKAKLRFEEKEAALFMKYFFQGLQYIHNKVKI